MRVAHYSASSVAQHVQFCPKGQLGQRHTRRTAPYKEDCTLQGGLAHHVQGVCREHVPAGKHTLSLRDAVCNCHALSARPHCHLEHVRTRKTKIDICTACLFGNADSHKDRQRGGGWWACVIYCCIHVDSLVYRIIYVYSIINIYCVV